MPMDFSHPSSLADYYDPIRVAQARDQSQMNALNMAKTRNDIQEVQQNQMGLAQLYKSMAPQRDESGKMGKSQFIDDMGAINWGAFLNSPEGTAWAQKYPAVAASLMEKAGILGGGTATGANAIPINSPEDKARIVALAVTPEAKLAADALEPGDVVKVTTKGGRIYGVDTTKESAESKFERLMTKKKTGTPLSPREQAQLDSIDEYLKKTKVTLPAAAADTKEQMAEDRYRKNLGGTLKLLSEGKILPPSSTFRPQYANIMYDEIEKWNMNHSDKQINPLLIKGIYEGDKTALSQMTKLATGAKTAAQNVENQMKKLLRPVVDKLTSTDITWINKKLRGVEAGVGSTNAGNFYALLSEIVPEYAKVMQGTGASVVAPTDAAMELSKKLLPEGATVAQLKSNMGIMERSMDIRMGSYDTTLKGLQRSLGANVVPEVSEPEQSRENERPAPGTIDGGYKFKGGDPSKKENWEKISQSGNVQLASVKPEDVPLGNGTANQAKTLIQLQKERNDAAAAGDFDKVDEVTRKINEIANQQKRTG